MGAQRTRHVQPARRRHGGAMEGHLRRQKTADGRNELQLGRRRLVGVRGRSALSGRVLGVGHSDWRELRSLFADALNMKRAAFILLVAALAFAQQKTELPKD